MRKFNYHSKDNGVWCRWSGCEVGEGYTRRRCPFDCKDSSITEPAPVEQPGGLVGD